MELVFNNLEWVCIYILVGRGGVGWGGVIFFFMFLIFDCVCLIYIVEIILSKELCFIKGMVLFVVNLDLNFD